MRDTPIVQAKDIDAATLLHGVGIAKLKKGQKYPIDHESGNRYRYLDIITAFDIETSKYNFGEDVSTWESWMYIWQWQVGDRFTVIGRTWNEFVNLVNSINAWMCAEYGADTRMLVFIHNEAFEFQYLSGIWDFKNGDLFATDVRAPLYFKMGGIECRCSYRLSGYGLDMWARQMRVDHQKAVGNLDYNAIRFSDTELTPAEIRYCVNDVLAVVECVQETLYMEGDTLYSLPYTSTGYIRRKVKKVLRMWCADAIHQMQDDMKTYDRLREAFRGGDTHCNRYWAGDILGDVSSYDRSSSYPDIICHAPMPVTRFREEKEHTYKRLQQLLDDGNAVLFHVWFKGLRLKNDRIGNPYIPRAKCEEPGFVKPKALTYELEKGESATIYPLEIDNGRILKAAFCEITVTDIDFEMIQEQYEWVQSGITWMMSSRYGYMPKPLIDLVISLYREKTALKGIDDELSRKRYEHVKALLNAIYGLFCTRDIMNPVLFHDDKWIIDEWKFDDDGIECPLSITKKVRADEYQKVIDKKMTGRYAFAVWITAWARKRLAEGIKLAESKYPDRPVSAFVYADTDSVKCRGELDFSEFNAARIRDAKRSGAYAVDSKGNTHYMGVFEYEGTYDYFRTWGAKRYCGTHGDELEITVAGVPKEAGSALIHDDGGIEAFTEDYVFVANGHRPCRKWNRKEKAWTGEIVTGTGKTGAVYDDDIDELRTVNGHPVHITRNVTIIEVDYSMELRGNYPEIIRGAKMLLDKLQYRDYNQRW